MWQACYKYVYIKYASSNSRLLSLISARMRIETQGTEEKSNNNTLQFCVFSFFISAFYTTVIISTLETVFSILSDIKITISLTFHGISMEQLFRLMWVLRAHGRDGQWFHNAAQVCGRVSRAHTLRLRRSNYGEIPRTRYGRLCRYAVC